MNATAEDVFRYVDLVTPTDPTEVLVLVAVTAQAAKAALELELTLTPEEEELWEQVATSA